MRATKLIATAAAVLIVLAAVAVGASVLQRAVRRRLVRAWAHVNVARSRAVPYDRATTAAAAAVGLPAFIVRAYIPPPTYTAPPQQTCERPNGWRTVWWVVTGIATAVVTVIAPPAGAIVGGVSATVGGMMPKSVVRKC